jgi:signal peptidase I
MAGRQALISRHGGGRLPAATQLIPGPGHALHGRVHHFSPRALLGAALEALLLAAIALAAFIALGLVGNPWYRVIGIDGGSMEPTLSRGDLIVVRPAPSTIEPGMILVITIGDETVTHRVVAVGPNGTFTTRGDANAVDDHWNPQSVKVQGLYVATIPWLGRVLPVPETSEALFTDEVTATMQLTVGPFTTPNPPPTPAECGDMKFAQVLVGTSGDDEFHAANGGALIFGLGGNDTIYGGNAKDCLVGGDGNDLLVGGNGKDVLLGEDGDDVLVGGGDNDVAEGGNGKDRLDGGDGTDACIGTRKDTYLDCESITNGSSSPATNGRNLLNTPEPAPTSQPAAPQSPGTAPSSAETPSPDPTPSPSAEPTAAPETPTPTPDPTPTVP